VQLNLLNNTARGRGSTNSAAPQPAPALAPPMPYGYYPPPPHLSWYPNPMPWAAGPGGLPHAPVPPAAQPDPTVPQKTIRGPRISPWLQYCDRQPGREGENFSALAGKFDDEGYRTIDQLTGSRMSVENLSNWFGIRKGIADLIIQYVEEDMAFVRDGNFTMDLEPAQERDWTEI
jgi:hypothetical protein